MFSFHTGDVTLSKRGCGTLGNTGNASRVRRIVGGNLSAQGAWPWQAAISYKNNGKETWTFMHDTFVLLFWWIVIWRTLSRSGRYRFVVLDNEQTHLSKFKRKSNMSKFFVFVSRCLLFPARIRPDPRGEMRRMYTIPYNLFMSQCLVLSRSHETYNFSE